MADFETALEVAVDENPANDPVRSGLPRSEAISLYKKKWNPSRRIITVGFLQEPDYIDKVIREAKKWEQHIGIQFSFGSSNPDVLIAFDIGGSWSYIGTDSLYYSSRGRPSMNFGWFEQGTDDEEFRRTTLHEFGHALSLVHEHSSPDGRIGWNRNRVYKYYADRGWGEDKVDQQIFTKYELSQLNGSHYDPTSIMHYPIPAELLDDPRDAVGWNTDISDLDKVVVSALYPQASGTLPL